MLKLIIILIAVILVITALRNFIRKYRGISHLNKKKDNLSEKMNDRKSDDDIVDAKFEEIK